MKLNFVLALTEFRKVDFYPNNPIYTSQPYAPHVIRPTTTSQKHTKDTKTKRYVYKIGPLHLSELPLQS